MKNLILGLLLATMTQVSQGQDAKNFALEIKGPVVDSKKKVTASKIQEFKVEVRANCYAKDVKASHPGDDNGLHVFCNRPSENELLKLIRDITNSGYRHRLIAIEPSNELTEYVGYGSVEAESFKKKSGKVDEIAAGDRFNVTLSYDVVWAEIAVSK